MTMKQVRLYGLQDLRIDHVARPTPGPRDIVVKVAAFGICGSDLNFAATGYVGRPTGQAVPLGHELAGTIAEVGAEVDLLKVGQRVVVHPMKDGNRIGTGDPDHGGFAEYLLVREAKLGVSIFPIADDLPFERAVLTEPIAVGVHGLNLGQQQPGERAVVFGAGPIGLGVVSALKHRGVRQVVAVDVIEERLERAAQLGAALTINPAKADVRAELEKFFGTVPRVVSGEPLVDCELYVDCAGHGPLLQQAVVMAKDGARIVVLARHKDVVPLDVVHLMTKELQLSGSLSYPTEFAEVLGMLDDKSVDLEAMVSHVFEFDEFPAAFKMAQDARQSAKVIVRV
ncbi:MAG: zinc-binding dehydrogenase [Pseudomonadota bacterium]